MVVAATGGLERAATAAWATAGRPGGGVTPRPARDGARATGPLAQTEAWEARALAPCADGLRPTPRPLPDALRQERRALLGRRQPLLGRRTAAPPRLAGTRERRMQASKAPMTWRKARRATLDDAREARLRASPRWRDNDALGQRAPGSGPGGARTVLLARPEVGTRTRQQSAAWGGVAPRKGARGRRRGRRTIWGGRAHVRTV
jgi:transposase